MHMHMAMRPAAEMSKGQITQQICLVRALRPTIVACSAAYCGIPDLVMACEPIVVAEPAPEPTPGVIYALGGHDGGTRLNTVEQYDPGLNTWTAVAPMSTVRSYHAAAVLDALGHDDLHTRHHVLHQAHQLIVPMDIPRVDS
jgi:hypothetical protein